MITNIELFPGEAEKSKPFFTPEQYEKFRDWWQETVVPKLEEQEEMRRRSIEDCFNRPPLKIAA